MTSCMVTAQTTFTESAASYNLDLNQNKDGGHAWSDFDNDGDLDVLVLENNNNAGVKSFLMQNNGGVFTNVRATLVPGMLGDRAERQAAWGDLNSDGRPDFMINSAGNSNTRIGIQIFIQNTNGTFGDGAGGFAPITVARTGATINVPGLNAEGTGFFDFEGDGDLDIFFDNHGSGIELLRNNYIDHTTNMVINPVAASLFTHITPGNGPGVVEFGLNQFATDGDFGSAADVNDDGWVDIFMRKRDENDFFLNQGGSFTNGADLAQAENGNKGGNGLWDLDNDGDLDAVWTENGLNQIFRNDGPGIWTPLGAATFPGLPQPANIDDGTSSNRIDALAGGDIDNDGDIDILFVGTNRSYLFINQLNSPTPAPGQIGSGAAMTFALDSETFNTGNGEGTTMIDIDDDGDLDIYMSISGRNQLYINNLPAANRVNHLIIDVTEDRDASGMTGGSPERVAIGTNILIRDCNGNIISGLRQVNGVFGHGTQSPEQVHIGLPLGENETYVIEVRYPNFYDPVEGFHRLIGTIIATPSTIPGTNHYSLNSTQAEASENINPPDAVDDIETVPIGTTVSVQLNLFDNDSEPDGENFFISEVVQPAIGLVVIDDADAGLVTYSYSAGTFFPGTTFEYTITDSPVTVCPALGRSDTATVTLIEPCAEPTGIDTDGDGINDVCDLDDDNDGILDTDEHPKTVLWVLRGSITSDQQNTIDKLTNLGYTVTVAQDADSEDANNYAVTYIHPSVFSGVAFANIANIATTKNGVITSENALFDELMGTTGASGNPNTNIINIINNTHPITEGLPLGNLDIGSSHFYVENIVSGTHLGEHPDGTVNLVAWEIGEAMDAGIAPGRRVAASHTSHFPVWNENGEDLLVSAILWTWALDTDGDGVYDDIDLDSDNDGIFDAVEASHGSTHVAGEVTGVVGLDGVPDTVQASGQEDSGNVNYTVADSDTDGIIDSIELDADNDGCNDVIEAGFTDGNNDGLLGPNPVTVDGNGLVTSGTDGYTVPVDADSNLTFDFQEFSNAPSISTQPADTTLCPGCDGSLIVTSLNSDTYQWQYFDGSSWIDLTNSGIYSGVTTNELMLTQVTPAENGNQYRVVISSSTYVCSNVTSNVAILTVNVPTVITNRRITYRVKKN